MGECIAYGDLMIPPQHEGNSAHLSVYDELALDMCRDAMCCGKKISCHNCMYSRLNRDRFIEWCRDECIDGVTSVKEVE